MIRGKKQLSRFVCLAIASSVLLGFGDSPVVAQATTAPERMAEKLPTVEKLLKKMVAAAGGEKALRKHTFRSLTGSMEIPSQGILGEFHSSRAKGNRSITEVSIPNFGEFLQGSNGTIVWSNDPQRGAQILEGSQRDVQAIQAVFYPLLDFKKTYQEIEIAGTTEHAGQTCYELILATKTDHQRTMYVNTTSYLVAGVKYIGTTPNGELQFISENTDYKEFDGVMIATHNMTDIGGFMIQILSIDDVSFEPLEKDTFDLPDDVKALLADEKPATSQPSD